jgi:TolB-like protein/Tfp pilus assembly protein PilF
MNLLRELRRRRVFRLAGLYIVGAWLAIQVASIFFPAWGIPETALRYFILASVVCFPLALIFSWRYDITSKGLVRTPPLQAGDTFDTKLKRADFLILMMLAAVLLAVLYESAGRIREETTEQRAESAVLPNSIAVLPFENLDTEQETAFFSDGVTEEILHRLSTLGALHVIGRTSSFAFRGAEEGPARIAEIIGVRYLLHGSVRRDSDEVRVTARLTDANGFQVWSQSFDRKLEGIFAIQSEIARQVSSKVLDKIVPLMELPRGRTTENMDAYNDYLVGLALVNGRPAGWQVRSESVFRQAIARDENFAPPYAGLAVSLFINRGPDLNDEALQAAERALELDPDLAEAHAAMGLILSELDMDFDRAVEHFHRAIELDPSFIHSYNWLAIAYLNAGRGQESREAQARGLAVDPLNPPLVVNVASRLAREGDPDRARELLTRLTYLPEPPGVVLWKLSDLEGDFGRFDESALWLARNVRNYAQTDAAASLSGLAHAYARLGIADWSEYWMERFEQRETDVLVRVLNKIYWLRQRGEFDQVIGLMQGTILPPEASWPTLPRFVAAALSAGHMMGGDYEAAVQILEAGPPPTMESFIEEMEYENALDFLHGLAFAYRRTGQDEKANRLLQNIQNSLEEELPKQTGYPPLVFRSAQNSAMRGATPEAIARLRRAMDLGFNNYFWVVSDDSWGETAEHPEFQRLLTEMKSRVDQQRAHFESVHDEQAFRQEIERLLAD